jgi:hypothetical protein
MELNAIMEGCGVKAIKPLRKMLFVITDAPPQKTASGLLFLPPKISSFYGELPHIRLVTGTVIAAGPKATTTVGARVIFQRLHFARWQKFSKADEPEVYVGWIDEDSLVGYPEDENGVPQVRPF